MTVSPSQPATAQDLCVVLGPETSPHPPPTPAFSLPTRLPIPSLLSGPPHGIPSPVSLEHDVLLAHNPLLNSQMLGRTKG